MAKLYFRYGAMNCGKTTHLLQVAHNYEERGMRVLLIKPAIDTKGEDKVVSRLGVTRQVDIQLPNDSTVMELMQPEKPNAILVDEAQFLSQNQVDELYYMTKIYDIPIICYGLRCDFQMQGFPGSTRLLQLADDIEEMKTICSCGKKATQNLRLINNIPVFNGAQVAIDNGENSISYESVCGECYIKKRQLKR